MGYFRNDDDGPGLVAMHDRCSPWPPAEQCVTPQPHWGTGWKWSPVVGDVECTECGALVNEREQSPWGLLTDDEADALRAEGLPA